MIFKRILVLLLFLLTICIVAPINGTLTGYIDSDQDVKGKSTILIEVYSDIGYSNYNPDSPRYVKERKKEFSKVNAILVNIKGYKSVILKRNTKAWNSANISNGSFRKSLTVKGNPIGKSYSLRFYDKKNKIINHNKGRVTYLKQDPELTDRLNLVGESLEIFISYFNHNSTYNHFKVKNCASYVVSEMARANEDKIAVQLLKTEIMNGDFKKNSIDYNDRFNTRFGDLYTSAQSMKDVLYRNGRNVQGYIIQTNAFTPNFKKKDEAIFFVNDNHYILVKKSSSTKWRVYDQNVNKGKPPQLLN